MDDQTRFLISIVFCLLLGSYCSVVLTHEVFIRQTDVAILTRAFASGRIYQNGNPKLIEELSLSPSSYLSKGSHVASPTVAVVVQTFFLTGSADLTPTYQERLLDGLRLALLSGAPWVILPLPSTWQCSAVTQFLQRITAADVFKGNPVVGERMDEGETLAGVIAEQIRMENATARVTRALNASLSQSPSVQHWLELGTPLEVLRPRTVPIIQDGGDIIITSGISNGALHDDGSGVWDGFRVVSPPRTLSIQDEEGEATYVQPGIMCVLGPQQEKSVASVLLHLIAGTALTLSHHHGLSDARQVDEAGQFDSEDDETLWWLNRTHHVIVVGGERSPMRTKLLYTQAIRTAYTLGVQKLWDALEAQEQFRSDAAASAQCKAGAPPSQSHTPQHGREVRKLLSRAAANVMVVASDSEWKRNGATHMSRWWLPFSWETPHDIPSTAPRVAKKLAVFSHYIYNNYRRFLDSMGLGSALQDVGRSSIVDFFHDIAENKISLSDVRHFWKLHQAAPAAEAAA